MKKIILMCLLISSLAYTACQGDVNQDSNLDVSDIIIIANHIIGINVLNSESQVIADYSSNSLVDVVDIILIVNDILDENFICIDDEISNILGEWSGSEIYPPTGQQYTFTFDDINFNVFSESNGNTITGSGTYILNDNSELNELDLLVDAYLFNGQIIYSNVTALCIYQILLSDTLKLACAEPGTDTRPTILGSETNMKYYILSKVIN